MNENKSESENEIESNENEFQEETVDKYIPLQQNRKFVYNLFLNLLLKYNDSESGDSCYNKKLALNIERGIFNCILQDTHSEYRTTWNMVFERKYQYRVSLIYTHLKPNSYIGNTQCLKRLIDGFYGDPFEFASITGTKLFPERYAELEEKHATKTKIEEVVPEVEDGMFRCGKCKSYKTTYYQIKEDNKVIKDKKYVVSFS